MAARDRETTKDLRWNVRVAEREDALVRAAAETVDINYTTFIRDAAHEVAQRVLANRRSFALDEDDWREFNELLDRAPQIPEGLKRLFEKPSVFE